MMTKQQIVESYLQKYPDIMTRTLARLLAKELPQEFATSELARNVIRTVRGAKGANTRHLATMPRPNGLDYVGGFKEEQLSYDEFEIPTSYKKLLILSDIHIPYFDEVALISALKYDPTIDSILLNGDIVDFNKLSRFTVDPKMKDVGYEIDMLYEFLCLLDTLYPNAKKYYKEGNHEYRIKTYLRIKAPELLGTDEFELPTLANFTEFGIEWIDKKRIIKFDKLNILHGHEFYGMSSAVNPARTLFLKAKKSALMGHLHQTSEHSEPDLTGKPIACWSVGCLCQLHPEYSPINKWNHGFAIVERRDGFMVTNKRIYNGKVL